MIRVLRRLSSRVSSFEAESLAVESIRSNPASVEALRGWRASLALPTTDFAKSIHRRVANIDSRVSFNGELSCLQAILPELDATQSIICLNALSLRALEMRESLRVSDVAELMASVRGGRLESQKVISLFEEKFFDDPADILSRADSPARLRRLAGLLAEASPGGSELLCELARYARILARENRLSLVQTAEIARNLLRSGSCFGLSGAVEAGTDPRRLPVKQLVKVLKVAVPARILSKDKILSIEKTLLGHLRVWLGEPIDLGVLKSPGFGAAPPMTDVGDLVGMFTAFGAVGCEDPRLEARLLRLIGKSLDGLSSAGVLEVVIAFCKGGLRAADGGGFAQGLGQTTQSNTNDTSHSVSTRGSFYSRLESEAALRAASLRPNGRVELLHALARFGRLGVPALRRLLSAVENSALESISISHVSLLLEALSLLRSYCLPPEMIKDPNWKQAAPVLFEQLRGIFDRVVEERVEPYMKDYKKSSFNLFLFVRMYELLALNARIYRRPVECLKDIEAILDLYDHDYREFKNQGVAKLDSKKAKEAGNEEEDKVDSTRSKEAKKSKKNVDDSIHSEGDKEEHLESSGSDLFNIPYLYSGLVRQSSLDADSFVRLVSPLINGCIPTPGLAPMTSYLSSKFDRISRGHFASAARLFAAVGDIEVMEKITKGLAELHEFGDLKGLFSHREFVTVVWAVMAAAMRKLPQFGEFGKVIESSSVVGPCGPSPNQSSADKHIRSPKKTRRGSDTRTANSDTNSSGVDMNFSGSSLSLPRLSISEAVQIRSELCLATNRNPQDLMADLLSVNLDDFEPSEFEMFKQIFLLLLRAGKMIGLPDFFTKIKGASDLSLFRLFEKDPLIHLDSPILTPLTENLQKESESLIDTDFITLIKDFSDEMYNRFPLAIIDQRKTKTNKIGFLLFSLKENRATQNLSNFIDVALLSSTFGWNFVLIDADKPVDEKRLAKDVVKFLAP